MGQLSWGQPGYLGPTSSVASSDPCLYLALTERTQHRPEDATAGGPAIPGAGQEGCVMLC